MLPPGNRFSTRPESSIEFDGQWLSTDQLQMLDGPGQRVGIEHLPLAIRSYRPGENPALARRAAISLDDAVERYEFRLIQEALEAAGGNRAEASRRLGISRARLLRKIDEQSKRNSKNEIGSHHD